MVAKFASLRMASTVPNSSTMPENMINDQDILPDFFNVNEFQTDRLINGSNGPTGHGTNGSLIAEDPRRQIHMHFIHQLFLQRKADHPGPAFDEDRINPVFGQ